MTASDILLPPTSAVSTLAASNSDATKERELTNDAGGTPQTIRQILSGQTNLTPAESKIVQLLLADYPVAGLGTAANLAKRAGVSDPTVARLVNKLGFEHFSLFQASLLEEVEARLRSPLMMIDSRPPGPEGRASGYMQSVMHTLHDMAEAAVDAPYDRAVEMVLSTKGRVLLLGGRFSRHVAAMLAAYLQQFRPGVEAISPLSPESIDRLVDLGKRDTLIVFDYRRYQTDVIAFVRQARARGVRVILFSDPWMSPIVEEADLVLIAPVEVASPYDSLAPAVTQIEALVAHFVAREKTTMEQRMSTMEALRSNAVVTIDGVGEKS